MVKMVLVDEYMENEVRYRVSADRPYRELHGSPPSSRKISAR
jgi:hypothetical protein